MSQRRERMPVNHHVRCGDLTITAMTDSGKFAEFRRQNNRIM